MGLLQVHDPSLKDDDYGLVIGLRNSKDIKELKGGIMKKISEQEQADRLFRAHQEEEKKRFKKHRKEMDKLYKKRLRDYSR